MENVLLISGVIVAYLFGSIPTSVWIGRRFYGIDVRTKGSKNAGATNTIRVLGLKAGLPVLLFDILKGWFSVYVSVFFVPESYVFSQVILYQIIIAFTVVLGHVFPVFANFRGGKGIATLLGVGIALYTWAVLVVIAIFALVLIITKYVSLGSITASVSFPFLVIFLFNPNSVSLIVLSIFVGVFVPLTHRKNITRLINGNESKLDLKKKK